MDNYEKKGYLDTDFKFFHLTDTALREFNYHYHEFDKIIIFLSGNVNYMIEGKSYMLEPRDILLVNRNDIHKPKIDFSIPYERIVIYISPVFMEKYHTTSYDLANCFHLAKKEHSNVIRIHPAKRQKLLNLIDNLKKALTEIAFASDLSAKLLFLEFMIHLNRAILDHQIETISTTVYDKKIIEILQYINANLFETIHADNLSQKFFISKYHMMRKFKEETGYSIHQYITNKRLLCSRDLIQQDIPITKVCFDCGFKDYSTFSRAFKSIFKTTPREYKKSRQ